MSHIGQDRFVETVPVDDHLAGLGRVLRDAGHPTPLQANSSWCVTQHGDHRPPTVNGNLVDTAFGLDLLLVGPVVLADRPTGRLDEFGHIVDRLGFQLNPDGIHELVEETHHGHAHNDPLGIAIGVVPPQLFSHVRRVVMGDGRQRLGDGNRGRLTFGAGFTGDRFGRRTATQGERAGVGRAVSALGRPGGGVHTQPDDVFGCPDPNQGGRQIQEVGHHQVVGSESGLPDLQVRVAVGDHPDQGVNQAEHRLISGFQLFEVDPVLGQRLSQGRSLFSCMVFGLAFSVRRRHCLSDHCSAARLDRSDHTTKQRRRQADTSTWRPALLSGWWSGSIKPTQIQVW